MNIDFVVGSVTRSAGGLYYSVSGLAKSLSNIGVRVRVIGSSDQFNEADRHMWDGLELVTYQAGSYGLAWPGVNAILGSDADLVHVHGAWNAVSVYGRIAGLKGIPVVVSPHGMVDPWILKRRPVLKSIHAALFERYLVGRTNLHALNIAELDACRSFLGRQERSSLILPNGINFVDSAGGLRRSGALYLGRLHPKKQVLELMATWASSSLLQNEILTVAGWGDDGYEASVRLLAQRHENIKFVGSLYGPEKHQAFRAAKALLLPSLSEGLPMAVLEALQFGCVPVITDYCNLPELFDAGVAKRISIDLSDVAAVTAALLQLPDDQLGHLSNKVKAYSTRFLWPQIAQDMIVYYQKVLEGERPVAAA